MSLRSRYKVFLGSQISKAMFCEILPDVAVHKSMDVHKSTDVHKSKVLRDLGMA